MILFKVTVSDIDNLMIDGFKAGCRQEGTKKRVRPKEECEEPACGSGRNLSTPALAMAANMAPQSR